ncbi:MAG: HypC/HybG/HupF family hydrogenase formation chaperone [Firmicutes bacterium]|nr:HypC/HybG/HupF family hydrogenase formation chaperone [Bacillota bacterium]
MCLAIPGRITDIDREAQKAVIDYDGLTKQASIRLLPQVEKGQLVLVHAGFVIQILDEEDGAELLELVREAGLYG